MSLMHQSMRILHRDADVLEFENRPVFWTIAMAGVFLVFVAGGIGAIADGKWGTGLIALGMMVPFYLFVFPDVVQLLQVRMDRRDGSLRVRLTTLKGRRETQYPLADLHRAEVDTRYGSAGNQPEHTITLVFQDGTARDRVGLKVFRLDPEIAVHMTGVINDWIGPKQDSPA